MSRKKTTEEFIRDAISVHGDRYDYSMVVYERARKEVSILCKNHGVFLQTPNNHLLGKGCPACAGNIRLSKDEFVQKALKIHGNIYDYSKVEYKTAKVKVCIICPKHGEFWQTPNNHLNGQACPVCGGSMPLDKDSFIDKARKKHGDIYDYSRVEYVNWDTAVCIVCPSHGEFWQRPGSHIGGCACPICARQNISLKLRATIDEFVSAARRIYGDKYDYSKVEYVNKDTKICIVCPDHGEFWQTPGHHLAGHQCPACSGVPRITVDDFIASARSVHGDLYDYSKTEYINKKTPVNIRCSIHGVFRQMPDVHLSGCGCPACSSSRLENDIYLLLKQRNIKFERQFGFEWLKDRKPLKLDFYLPEYSVAIECQGIQHFKSIDFFGGEDALSSNIIRDKIKRDLCLANGVSVFYYSNLGIIYPYHVYEDAELMLNEITKLKP